MALLRTRLLSAAQEHKSLPLLSATFRRSATTTSKEKESSRTGFLEQMRRDLLPELSKPSPHTSHLRRPPRLDDREEEFKRMLVRPQTTLLRDVVISPYATEPTSPAVSLPPQLVILDGVKGVGKSSVLEQTAAFARLKGYIVLYIPDPEAWTHGSGFFAAAPVAEMDPVKDGLPAVRFYDRPAQMHNVFKAMLEKHRDALGEVECRREFETEGTAKCDTLLDLVELGDQLLRDVDTNWSNTPALAGDVFNRLVKELCACESKPVAIVIDNFERFVGLTCMENERSERLHANSIRAVAEHFGRDAIERTATNLRNGFVLLATDPMHPFESWRRSRVRSGVEYPLSEQTLRDPSGRLWLDDLKSRIKGRKVDRQLLVGVPELTPAELKTLCATFVTGGLKRLVDDHNPAPEQERLIALAGGRADLMRKIAISR